MQHSDEANNLVNNARDYRNTNKASSNTENRFAEMRRKAEVWRRNVNAANIASAMVGKFIPIKRIIPIELR